MSTTNTSPLLAALTQKKVSASVVDFDHHRIHGGVAVETDYIVSVEPTGEVDGGVTFAAFRISKTYSAFRTLANQLKKVSNTAAKSTKDWDRLSPEVKHAIKFSESVVHLVESQGTEYLGKVNFKYVKSLAQKRSQTINDILDSILRNFPDESKGEKFVGDIAHAIENFFLTDIVEEEEAPPGRPTEEESPDLLSLNKLFHLTPAKGPKKDGATALLSPVVPVTRKRRASVIVRVQEEAELQKDMDEAKLLLDDDRDQTTMLPSYAAPESVVSSDGSKIGEIVENNPYVFLAIVAVSLWCLRAASYTSITIDTDIALLIAFACFCIGFHVPRKARVSPAPAKLVTFPKDKRERSSSLLLRKSMMVTPKGEEKESMLAVLDEEYELEDFWSLPNHKEIMVRGANYLKDKKKVPSGPYLFITRGVDLFLTDACPENVGRNSGILRGKLRDVPTFIVNFRLPWGVLLFYFEIPDMFLPFIKKRYEPEFDAKLPSLDKMTPGQRTACRWLLGDDKYKDERLKIVPVVVEGPWVVKSVVGGKPAILGTKLPVSYVYQAQEGDKALYLEADLDIVASSAARGILSVVRSYTQGLEIDLGFVIQGNKEDELPEQMLTGTRLHGIDPLTAPPLPPMKDLYMDIGPSASADAEDATVG